MQFAPLLNTLDINKYRIRELDLVYHVLYKVLGILCLLKIHTYLWMYIIFNNAKYFHNNRLSDLLKIYCANRTQI